MTARSLFSPDIIAQFKKKGWNILSNVKGQLIINNKR